MTSSSKKACQNRLCNPPGNWIDYPLDNAIRGLAIDDEDLKPLWDWITDLE